MAVDLLDATVRATYSLTPRVWQLVLQVKGHTFEHAPGQHVSVRYDPGDGPVYARIPPSTVRAPAG